ncbi:hypothetical protein FGO68_gene10925 [Halteria grandinella]|uniref:Uncharacterized protein n=1 Tax=Halteria grandinella TaxID=5974 RepID=A0A8J8P3Q0_HALGN|nr:hypothetical protein FGO68_gene10925 [Halteria grandinella]
MLGLQGKLCLNMQTTKRVLGHLPLISQFKHQFTTWAFSKSITGWTLQCLRIKQPTTTGFHFLVHLSSIQSTPQ